MSNNIKKPPMNVTTAKKAPAIESGVLPPRYQPPPQPKPVYNPPATLQDGTGVVAVGDSGKQFQTVAEIDIRHQPSDSKPRPPQYLPPPAPPPTPGLPPTNAVEMLKFVRKPDAESARMAADQTRRMAGELRNLKEANQRLSDDNQELRDLCCFLDDDRQKGRKLAREWQRFGRYTASVMRQEVSAYQAKLRELDTKQHELIKDNLELKELCLYLDEERSGACRACGAGLRRDDGDGSSSSTNADEPHPLALPPPAPAHPPANSLPLPPPPHAFHRPLTQAPPAHSQEEMVAYCQRLEARVKLLEEEKRALQQKLSPPTVGPNAAADWPAEQAPPDNCEAVVQALQVLEVREQLERSVNGSDVDLTTPDMDDGEKALLREMCNVVWRKLGEGPNARRQ